MKVDLSPKAISLPFEVGDNKKIAVKIVDDRGIESLKIMEVGREERIRACYQHACLLYVSGKRMSNTTLRKRLGIKESSYPIASRIISETIDAGLIRLHSGTRRDASYVPFWA